MPSKNAEYVLVQFHMCPNTEEHYSSYRNRTISPYKYSHTTPDYSSRHCWSAGNPHSSQAVTPLRVGNQTNRPLVQWLTISPVSLPAHECRLTPTPSSLSHDVAAVPLGHQASCRPHQRRRRQGHHHRHYYHRHSLPWPGVPTASTQRPSDSHCRVGCRHCCCYDAAHCRPAVRRSR